MKINQSLVKEHIEKSFDKGYIEIVDHRNNTLILNNGSFEFNGCVQPKSKASIESIFLEAFKLTRSIKLNDQEYIRELNKWYLKNR